MKYNFSAMKYRLENGKIVWMLESALNGCASQAYNLNDAIKQLEINEIEWIKTAKLYNIPVPEEME